MLRKKKETYKIDEGKRVCPYCGGIVIYTSPRGATCIKCGKLYRRIK